MNLTASYFFVCLVPLFLLGHILSIALAINCICKTGTMADVRHCLCSFLVQTAPYIKSAVLIE